MYSVEPQVVEQFLRYISFVREQFFEDIFQEHAFGQRSSIIHIARSDDKFQEFSLVIYDDMQFESIEPAHGGLAALHYAFEHLVLFNPLVMANTQTSAVGKGNSCAFAKLAHLQETREHKRNLLLQFHETVIRNKRWKIVFHMQAHVLQIKMFQTLVSSQVKKNKYRRDLAL
jgi:hypothetical protein